jgi:hypothetical protein
MYQMESAQLIPAEEFCTYYNIDVSFIQSLEEFGLIEVTTVEERGFIAPDQLKDLEQFVRLYYDLGINLEGIDAITNILQKVRNLQHEIYQLRNRLYTYESQHRAIKENG